MPVVPRILTQVLLRSLGLLILAFLLLNLDLVQVGRVFGQVAPGLFGAALLLNLLVIIGKSLRWRVILKAYGRRDSWRRLLTVYLAGNFLGLTTPGQAGEFAKVALLPGGDKRLLPSVAADRLLDVLPHLIIGVLGGMLYLDFPAWSLGLLFLVLLTLLGVFLRLRRPADPTAEDPAGPAGGRLRRWLVWLVEACRPLGRVRLAVLGPLVLAVLAVFFTYIVVLARSLRIETDVVHLVFFVSLFSLSRILPISIMGVGTRDALAVVLFGTVGVPAEPALSFSLSILLVDLIFLGVGFGAYQWLVSGPRRGGAADRAAMD